MTDGGVNLQSVKEEIHRWMDNRENNAIEPGSELPAFDTPLVGCAAGNDPMFEFLKDDIGPDFYWTPKEAYEFAYEGENIPAEELSIISWVLPQTKNTKLAHRKASSLPSIEWSCGRYYGEQVNNGLRTFVAALLSSKGLHAFAPAQLPQWDRAISPKYGFASKWSERHTAHVCGLGTFGLSDGLITPVGKAIRVGSVIVRKQLEPTPRLYTKHNEWCLYAARGKCLACVKRCPAGAISENGHDKEKCKAYIRGVTAVHVEKEQLGFRVNSCGLCQVKVPCESRVPVKKVENE